MMLLKAVNAAKTPGIVTSNLSLYLSAHNPNSYGGSGSTWTDLSTNANNGTLTNSPSYSSSDGGYFDFDGVNDFVTDDSTTGTPFGFGTGAFTVEFWVKYDDDTAYHVVLDTRRRTNIFTSNLGYSDYRDITDDKYYVYYNNGNIFTSTGTFATNTWYHVVLSRNSTSTNDTRFYINNVLDKTTTMTQSFTDYGNYYLGRNVNTTGTAYANIKLAQIRTYKGKALTAAEVEQNFNAHRRLYGL
jgi:hypothetical protein